MDKMVMQQMTKVPKSGCFNRSSIGNRKNKSFPASFHQFSLTNLKLRKSVAHIIGTKTFKISEGCNRKNGSCSHLAAPFTLTATGENKVASINSVNGIHIHMANFSIHFHGVL